MHHNVVMLIRFEANHNNANCNQIKKLKRSVVCSNFPSYNKYKREMRIYLYEYVNNLYVESINVILYGEWYA